MANHSAATRVAQRLLTVFAVPAIIITAIAFAMTSTPNQAFALGQGSDNPTTVTASPTPIPAELAQCNERMDAAINGTTATIRNWNSSKSCAATTVAYVRTGTGKYPQTRVHMATVVIPPMGSATASFGTNSCVQKDVIYGTDAPDTLTREYFTPAGTLITADDSGLWKEGCTPTTTTAPPVKTDVTFNGHLTCSAPNGTAVYTLFVEQTDGPNAVFSPANGTIMDNGNAITVTATWEDPTYGTQTKTMTVDASDNCTPVQLVPPAFADTPQGDSSTHVEISPEITCPFNPARIVEDLSQCEQEVPTARG